MDLVLQPVHVEGFGKYILTLMYLWYTNTEQNGMKEKNLLIYLYENI